MTLSKARRYFIFWWIVHMIVWTVFRLFPSNEAFSELFAKPFLWIGTLVLFLVLKNLPSSVILTLKQQFLTVKPVWKIFLAPFLAATALYFIYYFPVLHLPQVSAASLLWIVFINFSTAIIEEITYRGVVYLWLMRISSDIHAFLITQILFVAVHIPILILKSESFFSALSHIVFIIIMGLVYTAFFRLNKSLYSAVVAHGTWNTLVNLAVL
jgi:membrane protease YdiL (CAAX protease family)